MSLARSLTISPFRSRFLCTIRFTQCFTRAPPCAGPLSFSSAGISNDIHEAHDGPAFVSVDRMLCRFGASGAQSGQVTACGQPGGGVVYAFLQGGKATECGISCASGRYLLDACGPVLRLQAPLKLQAIQIAVSVTANGHRFGPLFNCRL